MQGGLGDSLNVRIAGRWPYGNCYAVAIDSLRDITFLGSGGGVYLFDTTDPGYPQKLSQIVTPDKVNNLIYRNEYLYIANEGNGLTIVSVIDPSNPHIVGNAETPGEANSIAVSGSYAYVADEEGGLRIISVADPTNPFEEGFYSPPGKVYEVAVIGNYAYISEKLDDASIRVISVVDPEDPVEVGMTETRFIANDIVARGDYVYIVDGWGTPHGLRIFSVSDPENPFEIGFLNTPGSGRGVALSDTFALVAAGDEGMLVISVSDPTDPYKVVDCETIGYAEDVVVSDGYAYVAEIGENPGLDVINISDPSDPRWVRGYRTSGAAYDVAVSGDYAYVAAGWQGLWILSISDPSNPIEVGNIDINYLVKGVAVGGDYAYLTYSYRDYYGETHWGLRCISVADPSDPDDLGHHHGGGNAYDVAASGDYAYVVSYYHRWEHGSFTVFRHWYLRGGYYDLDCPTAVDVGGNHAYVTDGRLHIFSLSDPTDPVLVAVYDPPGGVSGVAVNGDYVYVGRTKSEDKRGLQVLSVVDPSNPVEMGYIDIPGGAGNPIALGHRVGVKSNNIFRLISAMDPMNPVELGYYFVDVYTAGFELGGHYGYIATHSQGVIVLEYYGDPTSVGDDDGNEPDIPRSISLSQNYPNPFNPNTTISLDIPGVSGEKQHVEVTVYDIRGRCVRMLIDSDLEPGSHKIHWNGQNSNGESVSSGIYLYTLKTGEGTFTRKMTVLK
jgi:hypothetical protein